MEDYNQIIFCNYVWETLANQNPETVTVFINIMLELNQKYQESGGDISIHRICTRHGQRHN
jgi:hypothetical protein